jgi:thiamine biosynthesis lipoprotein
MATACDRIRRARPLLGTFVEIEAAGPERSEIDAAIDAGFEAVACVHRLMSFHEAESDVSRLNRDAFARPIPVHAWTFEVLEAAVELHRRSNGVFDIAIAPHLQAMGLLPPDAAHVAVEAPPTDAVELTAIDSVRFTEPGLRIDLGGIAKGFAVDRALEAMLQFDVLSSLINAGGDLAVFGEEGETVHIRDPRDPSRLIGSVDIANEALATTGRRFDPATSDATMTSTIIDPATGKPASGIDGVTVRAPSCMIADALTKVVMIRGIDCGALLEYYRAGALMISAERDVQITPNLKHVVRLAA